MSKPVDAYTRLALAYKAHKGFRMDADEVQAFVECDDAIEQVVLQIPAAQGEKQP